MFALAFAFITYLSNSEIFNTTHHSLTTHNAKIVELLSATDSLVSEQVKRNLHELYMQAKRLGQPNINGSSVIGGKQVPTLYFGSYNQINDFTLVDQVVKEFGGSATLFVRAKDEYVRVSTTILREGKRAVGTILALHGRAASYIMRGEPYFGMVDILGEPYITGYMPMIDQDKRVIGIWYVGFKADTALLQHFIKTTPPSVNGEAFTALLDEHGRIRAVSQAIDNRRVAEIMDGMENWVQQSLNYEPWSYTVTSGISRDSIDLLMSERLYSNLKSIIFLYLLTLACLGILTKIIATKKNGRLKNVH